MAEKQRLDVLMVEKGLAESREKAKAMIMAGQVYIDNQKCDKAGQNIDITKTAYQTLYNLISCFLIYNIH